MLKAPGTNRLNLYCDELLSSFVFNFNLRRYNVLLWKDFADVSKAKDVSGDGSTFSISGGGGGRGLHSSTSQLNLSQF